MTKETTNKEALVLKFATKEKAPTIGDLGFPEYECPKHGNVKHHISSNIKGFEGIWCQICILEKLDELGVSRLTKIK